MKDTELNKRQTASRAQEMRNGATELKASVGERGAADEARDEPEFFYRAVVENQTELVIRFMPDGTLTFVNAACCRCFGKNREELIGGNLMAYVFEQDREYLRSRLASLSPENPVCTVEYRVLTPVGEIRWQQWTNRALFKGGNRPAEFQGVGRDVTERRRTEEALLKARRTIEALSECNQALIHIEDELELLHEICRIIVVVGNYRMAWVGYAEHDEDRRVTPVARYGYEEGYLDLANITWRDTERGRGPVGASIRTGAPSVVRYVESNPDFSPWRDEAVRRGYASVIGIPLFVEGRVLGVLAIYAVERNAFDTEEFNLLLKLAGNLSHGIEALRARRARKQAEEALQRERDGLERRVEERTAELMKINEQLRQAIEHRKEATEALRETAQLLRATIESTADGILVIGEKGEVITANDRFFKMWKLPEEIRNTNSDRELLSSALKQLQDPESFIAKVQKLYTSMDEDFDTVHFKDGRIYERYSCPLIRSGKITGRVWNFHDVTERSKAEEVLRESEERFRSLFEKSQAVKLLLDAETGVIVDANPAAGVFYGYSQEILRGMSIFEINILPKERILKSMGVAATERCKVFHFKHRLAGGEIRDVEVFSNPIIVGGRRLLYSIIHDVTERRRAEESLRRSEEFTRTLLDNIADRVFAKDTTGRYTLLNRAAYSFWNIAEGTALGKTDWDIYDKETARSFVESDGVVLEKGQVHATEARIKTGHAGEVVLSIVKAPLRDKRGNITGLVGVSRDITHIRRSEEALSESERQLKYLSSELLRVQENERKRVANEIHDNIGGTLSAIKLGLENLRTRIPEGVAAPETFQSLIALTRHAIEEARRIYMNLRPSVLDDLGIVTTIGWFIRQFQTIHQDIEIEKHIEIEEEKVPDSLKIIIFRTIQEAFHNISRHSRAQRVELTLVREGDVMELTIRDNGTGFALGNLPPEKLSTGGLGLPSMQERVESSGGIFCIKSVRGEGTVIRAAWYIDKGK